MNFLGIDYSNLEKYIVFPVYLLGVHVYLHFALGLGIGHRMRWKWYTVKLFFNVVFVCCRSLRSYSGSSFPWSDLGLPLILIHYHPHLACCPVTLAS